MSQKRKIKYFTLEEKVRVLDEVKEGKLFDIICTNHDVGESTLRRWIQNETEIRELSTNNYMNKHIGKDRNRAVNDAVYLWFRQRRERGVAISGPIIKKKAAILNEKIGKNPSFRASDGWLSKWKSRHGIRELTICGELKSADHDAAARFIPELTDHINTKGYSKCQIFNCDETGFNYKMLPKKTLTGHNEKGAAGFKINKERLTVLVCSNADGSLKLPLLIIGKYENPRAIQIIKKSLPANLFTSAIVLADEKGIDVSAYLKTINIKDVIYWVSDAWARVLPITIEKCWNKLFGISEKETLTDNHANLIDKSMNCISRNLSLIGYNELSETDTRNWVEVDPEFETVLTDEEIVQYISQDESIEEYTERARNVSPGEAFDGLEMAISYFEQCNILPPEDYCKLLEIQQTLFNMHIDNKELEKYICTLFSALLSLITYYIFCQLKLK